VYYAYSPISPSFVAKLQTNVKIKIKIKNSVIYSFFFLDKFFKFKNENYNYNHIFTWIFGGGEGRKGDSGLSIFLHVVIHPIKLQGLVLQGNTTF
jgi:hypothetical protein